MKSILTNKKVITIIGTIVALIIVIFGTTGCASWDRFKKDINSNVTGGIDRIVNIYNYNGDKIATYEGKIDVQQNESKVLFELNGKRYVYYNSIVEVIEK